MLGYAEYMCTVGGRWKRPRCNRCRVVEFTLMHDGPKAKLHVTYQHLNNQSQICDRLTPLHVSLFSDLT